MIDFESDTGNSGELDNPWSFRLEVRGNDPKIELALVENVIGFPKLEPALAKMDVAKSFSDENRDRPTAKSGLDFASILLI